MGNVSTRPPRTRWQPAFVAVSSLLGEPPEAATLEFADGDDAQDAALVQEMRAGSREARAVAIARVVSDVAFAIDASRLG